MSKYALRRACFSLLLLFATAHHAFAQDWIIHYYEHPTPERFVTEVRALGAAGHLCNPKTTALMSVFLSKVMAANPARVDGWLTDLRDLNDCDRQALLAAAAHSNTSEARAYLGRQPDAAKYLRKPVDLDTLDMQSPSSQDLLWAAFFASGEEKPVRQIVGALEYGKYAGAIERYQKSEKTDKDRDEAVQEAVFKAALWSLESNAKQHRRVGEILEHIYFEGSLSQQEKLWLSFVLSKAMPDKYEFNSPSSGHWTFKRKDAIEQAAEPIKVMVTKDEFSGSLLATTDEDWKQKWETPPAAKPSLTMAGTVPYDKKITILTFFANPKLDPQGKADVRCAYRILDPAGKVAHEQKETMCYAGAVAGVPHAIHLASTVLGFAAAADDPPGTWTIELKLRDKVRDVELPLTTKFELKRQ